MWENLIIYFEKVSEISSEDALPSAEETGQNYINRLILVKQFLILLKKPIFDIVQNLYSHKNRRD